MSTERPPGVYQRMEFMRGEDPQEFWALLNDLTTQHQPATPVEKILVEKMAQSQWASLRATRLQSELLAKQGVTGASARLSALLSYQTASDRAFHRAHKELLKSKKLRPKQHKLFLVKR